MTYFKAENLHKIFSNIQIDFSMESEKESMTCILGPSGSGKSTVLKMIAGLENSDKNPDKKTSVFLDGRDITNLPPQKRNIGMVFQQPSLFLNMNVLENISYGLRNMGWAKKAAFEEAEKMLEIIKMEDFGKRSCESLSGGEAQRVCLARSLIVKPKLILFDEPLSALDAPLRKRLGEDILMMQEQFHFTSIMVTHDIEEAVRLSDRIILMKKGTIISQCSSRDFNSSMME